MGIRGYLCRNTRDSRIERLWVMGYLYRKTRAARLERLGIGEYLHNRRGIPEKKVTWSRDTFVGRGGGRLGLGIPA
jgi:hypothetical protein